jgi:peptidylprolyl isomerase
MTRNAFMTIAALAAGLAIGACGSSSSVSTAPGVQLAPSAGPTSYTGTVTTAASSTATTPAVATPTTGPLSKEPKIAVPSGPPPKKLETKDLVKGTGTVAAAGDQLTVNYVGALYKNGKVFDASWNRHQTFPFQLSTTAVIPGWVEGIAGMRVGGRRELIIPPALAYGKTGSGSTIPPNSTLIFIVDLLAAS